jgi:hypothetical protein
MCGGHDDIFYWAIEFSGDLFGGSEPNRIGKPALICTD